MKSLPSGISRQLHPARIIIPRRDVYADHHALFLTAESLVFPPSSFPAPLRLLPSTDFASVTVASSHQVSRCDYYRTLFVSLCRGRRRQTNKSDGSLAPQLHRQLWSLLWSHAPFDRVLARDPSSSNTIDIGISIINGRLHL